MTPAAVATRFEVSVAWVYRVLQRRRESGSIAPRKQTKFRGRALSSDEEVRLVALITVRPDATLAELQHALPTRAALSTLWRTIDRLGLTVKKNRIRRRAATA
jgi:transposase